MHYLRNCWYMAAWAGEIPRGATLSRTILGDAVALYRGFDDKVRALLDRCPHRFAPLSRGRVEGNNLICSYHGLGYGPTGTCEINPHGAAISALSVTSFPVHEAYRAIWIWMGAAEKADTELLPGNLIFLSEAPDTAFYGGYLCGPGNYQLFVDNILDLTHADFLHADSLGGGHFTRTRAKVTDHGHSLSAYWHCMDEKPSPMMASRFKPGDRVNIWIEVDWYAPTIMTLRSGAALTNAERTAGRDGLNVHIMTPETEFSTHYFYGLTREHQLEDHELTNHIAEITKRIFEREDKPMIEAQQERIGTADFWSLNPILLRTDEAAVRIRRKLAKMIESESQASCPTQ